MKPVAVIFHRLGPYHVARLDAAGRLGSVVAVELSAHTTEYAWDRVEGTRAFERVTVFTDPDSRLAGAGEVIARLDQTLTATGAGVVAIPGWSDNGALAALRWCRKARVPAVVMSESQTIDEPRTWWKEAVKRQVVGCYAAALAGGRRHVDYLTSLGMPPQRVFTGYDVVDNDYFARHADAARHDASRMRARLGLPERYFLASNRFLKQKNLPTLLRAYASYRTEAGSEAWKLVLLGDGPLRDTVLTLRRQLGLEEDVLLPGFKQYEELPAYYGLAQAFVHASTSEQWGLVVNEAMAAGLPVIVSERCGSSADLVVPGRNGYTFDPFNVSSLAVHLANTAGGKYDLAAMGKASRELIRPWSPQTFAAGLWGAVEAARKASRRKGAFLDRILLGALIRR